MYRIKQEFTDEQLKLLKDALGSEGVSGRLLEAIFAPYMESSLFEVVPRERWKPKLGEDYWYLASYNFEVSEDTWNSESSDITCYELGNCFKTREEAEEKRDQIKSLLLNK